jgi:hypothetical protein
MTGDEIWGRTDARLVGAASFVAVVGLVKLSIAGSTKGCVEGFCCTWAE